MKHLACALMGVGLATMTLTCAAVEVTWNPAAGNLSDTIATVWIQSGDHIVNIPNGTHSGPALGVWSDNITWELMGARAANSIGLVGAGRASTVLLSWTGSMQNGMNRINAVGNFTGITFKNLTLAMGSSGSLFGLWQNGDYRAEVTFEDCDVFTGSGALIGRVYLYNGDDGQVTFFNSNLYTAHTTLLVQWDYNAGRPVPFGGLVDGTCTGRIYDWGGPFDPFNLLNTANYAVDPTGGDLQRFSIGAGNGPAGFESGYQNDNTTYGAFITQFNCAPAPPPPDGMTLVVQ